VVGALMQSPSLTNMYVQAVVVAVTTVKRLILPLVIKLDSLGNKNNAK